VTVSQLSVLVHFELIMLLNEVWKRKCKENSRLVELEKWPCISWQFHIGLRMWKWHHTCETGKPDLACHHIL